MFRLYIFVDTLFVKQQQTVYDKNVTYLNFL